MPFTLGPRAAAKGYSLVAFDQIGSTNAEAIARARDGERGPTWFVTSEQTAGRGRRHRPWVAPRGNLASSILEVIDVVPTVAATLGFAAGLALETALRRLSVEAVLRAPDRDDLKFSLKWPNDVLAGRRKLAGILLEAEAVNGRLAVVVGIGTNVVAAPEGTPTPATSLRALGVDVDAESLFAELSVSGTMAAALSKSGGSGWSGRRGLGRQSPSHLVGLRSKAHSIPLTSKAA
jgi:BirA family transcriptional regulator, biotin operon repressor / biotin---[acetyl-CoA-carboxylase] ligase